MSSCMGIVSVGHDLFPEIDKQMTKYLTPHILSAEQSEMAQCLYFVVSQINLTNDNEDFSSLEVTDEFVENLKHSRSVENYKYTTSKQQILTFRDDNNIVTEACCFINKESAKNYSNELLTPNPSTIPKSVTHVLRLATQRKLKYGEVWGLVRHALLSITITARWLHEFTKIQDNANKENELRLIKNLLVSRRKGRPETKCYKFATEKKGKLRVYACGTCNQPGHNSATCQNH
ncbi:hypothetical protein Glove_319g97 [Diversispora epigaea]|uniref:CCHC-type domain-containing protein n=1 Tax=Diversispora epigaea TaxID=1348612 RepID=A0A397HV89_9GLOM|nr:hypothetical protein Glove_319g97 [Diversispora epigaea]